MTIQFKNFWYIIAESNELTANKVIARQICDEWLVCYRGEDGLVTVMPDRCLHRCGRLSDGVVNAGLLKCPYHGWIYDGEGKVVHIPSMSGPPETPLKARTFATREQDGYIYVRLLDGHPDIQPFSMQYYQKPGWKSIRLQHVFQNNLSNCVENFIDIPHTAFVHHGIFRSSRNEPITAKIIRRQGEVHVTYRNEKQNLGSFNFLLNPRGQPIIHTDSFFMPNVTFVSYSLASKWQYVITSQSVPISEDETRVYTELSYQLGIWTPLASWIVKRQAKKVIQQDLHVLAQQMHVIKKYGNHFYDTPADKIHAYVSEIHQALENNLDPKLLPDQEHEVTFWV
jgi:phenylpropionate dioxygenase-like ring-hydroxylating dioxygenase large terminal subunit